MDGKETIEGLKDRITGRYSCEDIYDKDGELIVGANHMTVSYTHLDVYKRQVLEYAIFYAMDLLA